MACRINQPGRGNSTWGSQRFIGLPSHERRGQAPGGIDQGKPQEMHHPPSPRQKLPAFFHGITSWDHLLRKLRNGAIRLTHQATIYGMNGSPKFHQIRVRTAHHFFGQEQPRAAVPHSPGQRIRLSPQKSPHVSHFYGKFFEGPVSQTPDSRAMRAMRASVRAWAWRGPGATSGGPSLTCAVEPQARGS